MTACFGLRHASERNFEVFSLPQNGSERNSVRLLLTLLHRTEFQAFFSPAERFGRNSENFLFRGTAGIPPEQTNCFVYSVFRGINFSRKLPTLVQIKPAPTPPPPHRSPPAKLAKTPHRAVPLVYRLYSFTDTPLKEVLRREIQGLKV